MIIRYTGKNAKCVVHNLKTVEEFINNEMVKYKDMENKYFVITTKKSYNGNRNLLLYYQDGKLKSHHDTGIKFDYNDVLNYEIHENYTIHDLDVNNIISLDYDNEEELPSINKDSSFRIDLETFDMSKREKARHELNKIFEEDNIIDTIIENRELSEDIIKKSLKILINRTEEISLLKNRIGILEKKVEQQSQQIKWLDKNK